MQSGDTADGRIEIELPRGLPDSVRSEAGEIRWAIEVVADITHKKVRICELPLEVYSARLPSIESQMAGSPVASPD